MTSLLSAVHLPCAYSHALSLGENPDLYYGTLLFILHDIARHGVLVAYEDRASRPYDNGVNLLSRAIRAWPGTHQKHREQALTLLDKKIQAKKRVILTRPPQLSRHACCSDALCHLALSTAEIVGVDVLVRGPACPLSSIAREARLTVTEPQQYAVSDFCSRCREGEGYEVYDTPTIRMDAFANDFWKPLFRFTSTVTIIDRFVADHLKTYKQPSMAKRWRKSLAWIHRSFVQHSQAPGKRKLQVYSYLSTRKITGHHFQDRVYEFAADTTGSSGVPMAVHILPEESGIDFPHDRYLITDHAAFQVSTGFDLLPAKGDVVRATAIKPVDWHSIDNLLKRLAAHPSVPVHGEKLQDRCEQLGITGKR